MFQCLQLQDCQKKGDIICRFGEIGDRFYVVLKGSVGVKVPTEVSESNLVSQYEVLRFVAQYLNAPILKCRDAHTRQAKQFLDLIPNPQQFLKTLNSLQDLIDYVYNLIYQEQDSLTAAMASSHDSEKSLLNEIPSIH